MKKPLNEITPSEQAKMLGLDYLGFGGWGKSSDRKVLARTIDGKLVRTDDNGQPEDDTDLGRLLIIDFDDELLYMNLDNATGDAAKFLKLIKSLVKTGNDIVILHSRNSEKRVAKFLKSINITAGPTLVPIGSSDPSKKKEFVAKKIKAGYSEIYFFDRDPNAIQAVESLKAPFNKVLVKLETYQIPELKYDPENRKGAKGSK
jgi:hypothetical protein